MSRNSNKKRKAESLLVESIVSSAKISDMLRSMAGKDPAECRDDVNLSVQAAHMLFMKLKNLNLILRN